jgi:hypothetical protein
MNSTQKINYLLSVIRPERALASVYSQIQTEQVRGTITFERACQDLRFRCEALRADDLFHATQQTTKVRALLAHGEADPSVLVGPSSTAPPSGAAVAHALITTSGKRQNKGKTRKKELVACLAKGCDTLTPPHLRLCKKCFHECIAGKNPTVLLKSGDKANYDPSTQRMVFPSAGETGSRKVVKAAVTFVSSTTGGAQ